MTIYDISQEVFSCQVYPGDPAPNMEALCRMDQGDSYNLTAFSMCAHNGTHMDAPFHFYRDGATVADIPLWKTVGPSYVIEHHGMMSESDAVLLLQTIRDNEPEAIIRILLKGKCSLSPEAAAVFIDAGTVLIGVEGQSVETNITIPAVHKILLGAEVVILEGIRLADISEGVYFLSAAPLSLAGSDGAPCRAILIRQ